MLIKFGYALLSYLLIYQYLCKQIKFNLKLNALPKLEKRRLGVSRHALVSGVPRTLDYATAK